MSRANFAGYIAPAIVIEECVYKAGGILETIYTVIGLSSPLNDV